MVTRGFFSGSADKGTRMANAGPSTPIKNYGGNMGFQEDFGAGRVTNVRPKPGVSLQDVYGVAPVKKVEKIKQENKYRKIAQAPIDSDSLGGPPEDDSGFEGYLRKIYGLEKTDKEYKKMPGFLKRDIRDSYRDDVESGTYKDPYRDQDQSSILQRAGDFVANVFTPPAVAGTLDGMPTRFTTGESQVASMDTPSVGDMVSNIEAAVDSGGRGGLGGSSSTVKTLGKKQPRVVSPMESGMGPGAAKARAMAKARNAAKESGTSTPSMSGADRAKALAKARIARKKKSTSSGRGFGRSTSSSRRSTSSSRGSTGRAGRRGGSAGSAGSRSRGATGSASRRSASSSRRSNTSRSRRGGTSSSRSRGGVSRGSRRRGGRRGRRGGRRCDIRLKYDINILSNYNLYKDDLAQLAYFVMDIKN